MSANDARGSEASTSVKPYGDESDDAIKSIEELISHLKLAKELFDAKSHWIQEFCTSDSVVLSHDAERASIDTLTASQAMVIRDVLKHGRDISQEVSTLLYGQFAAVDAHVSSLILRAGVSTLPDEILASVLEFACYREGSEESFAIRNTVDAAIKLSHVCSRFRTLIVATVCLWNRISSSMKMEAISVCFRSCGLAGVGIVLSMSSSQELAPFCQIIKQNRVLWKRFEYSYSRQNLPMHYKDTEIINEWIRNTHRLEAPILLELVIRFPFTVPDVANMSEYHRYEKSINFYTTWTLPNLRTMTLDNLFPVVFPATKSLVEFTLHLDFCHRYPDGFFLSTALIATFLSSCHSLQKFIFNLRNCNFLDTSLNAEVIHIKSVTTLIFEFFCCSRDVVEAFCTAIHFPEALRMELMCTWDEEEVKDGVLVKDESILDAIFPSRDDFPKLRNLTLDIIVYGPYRKAPNSPISIPFSNLSHLKQLELTTWTTVLAPLPEDVLLPRLDRLLLVNCTWVEHDWFLTFCDRTSSHRDPNEPLELLIFDCPWGQLLEERWRSRSDGVHNDSISNRTKGDVEEEDSVRDPQIAYRF